jgi:hypothetical protein
MIHAMSGVEWMIVLASIGVAILNTKMIFYYINRKRVAQEKMRELENRSWD